MQWDLEFDIKKIRAAAELARNAARSRPESIGPWLILGLAHIRLGEFAQAASCLRGAISVLPPTAELQMMLVEALLLQDLFEEALPHAKAALALDETNVVARRLYYHVLASLKCWDQPGLDAGLVDEFSATNPRVMAMQTRSLGPADRLAVCDSHLARDPANTSAKFMKAVTLASLGRTDEARDLISLDRLIEVQVLTPPPGYADDQAFRDALAQEIRANPTLSPDPRLKATRDGLHTRQLRQEGAVAIESLLARIRQAVDAYELRLAESGDGFAIGRPQKVRLVAWAVVHGRAGRQKAHRHPSGWLSGSYYVAAPRPDGEDAFRGPLIMGAVDPGDCAVEPPWGTREIEPLPGRLVLFPSYVPHATAASGVDGARICVAFDVVPVRDSAVTYGGMS